MRAKKEKERDQTEEVAMNDFTRDGEKKKCCSSKKMKRENEHLEMNKRQVHCKHLRKVMRSGC